jgi:hypothetical protein
VEGELGRQLRARSTALMAGVARSAAVMSVEMLHVGYLDVDHHVEKIHRSIDDAEVGDVALVAGDHRGQARQAAGLVRRP